MSFNFTGRGFVTGFVSWNLDGSTNSDSLSISAVSSEEIIS